MKKTKKIAIVFSIVLLIGVAAFATVYYFTDIFKTPQEAFYSYIDKAAKIDKSTSYQEILEELKIAKEKSYKTETTLGIEINSKDRIDNETQQMINMVKNLKLNINSNSKPSEEKTTSNISLNFGTLSAGNLKLVKDGDLYGIKSDLLGNKYLAVENNNLKELVKKLGGDSASIPNKFESIDLYDLLYVSKEDQFNLEKTYKDIFKNNISADNFSKEENVKQKINGEDVNTTAYKLSLDEKDFINVMTKVLETAEEDDTLLNLITEKFNKIIDNDMIDEINVSTSYSLPSTLKTKKSVVTEKITKNTLKQSLRSLINEFKEESEYAGTTKAEVIVYSANNDIAKLEVKTNNEVIFAADFYKKDDKNHVIVYISEKSYSIPYYYTDNYKTTSRKTSELVKLMEIEYKTTKFGNDSTLYASFTIFKNDEEVGTFGIDTTSKGKVGQGKYETSGKVFFEVEGVSIALVIDSKTEFTDNVEVESLNNSNSNILNNMTEKEIQKYFEGIREELESTLSMFGLNNRINLPNNKRTNNYNNKYNLKIDDSNIEEKDAEDEKQLDADELQKQIDELNEKLKELQA